MLAALASAALLQAKDYVVASPDGNVVVTVSAAEKVSYTVDLAGIRLLDPSFISMTLQDGTVFGGKEKFRASSRSVDVTVPAQNFKRASVRDHFNELTLSAKRYDIVFRAYDDGVAYRFVAKGKKGETVVTAEQAEFAFPADWNLYVPYVARDFTSFEPQFFNSFENTYAHHALSAWEKGRLAFLPLTVEAAGGIKLCVTESDLLDYPGMYLYNGNASKTLTGVYGAKPYTMEELTAWVENYGGKIRPFLCDTGAFLRAAADAGKRLLFEAQLGALRDLDYGIYPYTTSSNAIAAYAPVGSGLPSARLDAVVGVVKAYSTCVGEGPFVCELFGEEASRLREAGGEYGAKTGRPRRVGPIDIVATRYGVQVQAATNIALTKLDILSYMKKIPVCTKYKLYGELTDDFPFPSALADAEPVIEYMDGWETDISKITDWNELPPNAQKYVEFIEKEIGCHIGYVSVGPERDSIIIR